VGLIALPPPELKGEPVARLLSHKGGVPYLLIVWRVGSDGTLVREFEREVGRWDAGSFNGLKTLQLAISRDGRLVACVVSLPRGQFAVRVWDLTSGALVRELGSFAPPHTTYISQDLAFSADGRRLFAGGKVWDLRTGLELLELTADLLHDSRAGGRPAFAYDGDVVYGLFASEEGIDSYAFDGTPRP
jgi:WD40 repeat protein